MVGRFSLLMVNYILMILVKEFYVYRDVLGIEVEIGRFRFVSIIVARITQV